MIPFVHFVHGFISIELGYLCSSTIIASLILYILQEIYQIINHDFFFIHLYLVMLVVFLKLQIGARILLNCTLSFPEVNCTNFLSSCSVDTLLPAVPGGQYPFIAKYQLFLRSPISESYRPITSLFSWLIRKMYFLQIIISFNISFYFHLPYVSTLLIFSWENGKTQIFGVSSMWQYTNFNCPICYSNCEVFTQPCPFGFTLGGNLLRFGYILLPCFFPSSIAFINYVTFSW